MKELAVSKGIPVFQPKTLRDEAVFEELKALDPELIVVVAYGKILPKNVLDLPKFWCINVHASLLPKYRGAGPIQWAILNGEKVTGVTTMYMGEGIDTGDMLEKASLEIGPDETADELRDRLSRLGADASDLHRGKGGEGGASSGAAKRCGSHSCSHADPGDVAA